MDRFVPRRHADWERSLDFSAGADDSAYAQRIRQVLDIERGSILFRGLRGAPPEKARGHAKVQRMGAFDLPGATGYGAGTSPADWGSNDSLAVWVPGNGIYARNMTTREVQLHTTRGEHEDDRGVEDPPRCQGDARGLRRGFSKEKAYQFTILPRERRLYPSPSGR